MPLRTCAEELYAQHFPNLEPYYFTRRIHSAYDFLGNYFRAPLTICTACFGRIVAHKLSFTRVRPWYSLPVECIKLIPYYSRVTSILLSRFMLNLRQTSETSGGSDGPSPSRLTANATAIGFRIPQSVIGNLSESFAEEAEIDYGPDNEVPSTSSPFNDKDPLPGE